ncbi:MAG: hypothetical protein P8P36_03490 [Akkermansiaceae bacterium]|nr:hypothetical protein [Akkermansiaceae bacterium]
MKYYLPTKRRLRPSSHFMAVIMAVASLLLITSCDKVHQLVDGLKDIGGQRGAYSTVDQMNQEQAEALIDSESKLVIVEFYTDT